MARDLPSGTVTFLFTDVEGSTKLLHELGEEEYADALMEHRRVVRAACAAHGGVEVDTQGDAFFIAFPTAPGALAAAAEATDALAAGPIRVRMGVYTGTPHLTAEGYVGADVHRAARVAACGNGGQILVSASTAALVGTDGLHDLGLHRLKDLSAPERIYQVGFDEFPPLRSLHSTNLPIPATPFLGRSDELAAVTERLVRDDVRLLTLTGTGGTGKTRLGLQSAAALADHYPDGVWWVPLASLREASLVMSTAQAALGAKNGLAEHVGDRAMLLFFDNFEQVIDAATDVATLLAVCPRLDVLVTSREPLRISGEHEYSVPPLAPAEGVAFFVSRAQAASAAFVPDDAVSEICRRLDDLPLALELAAARVKVLTPRQILARLEHRLPLLTGGARDLPERQRTLRATIEWSYGLLQPEEQELFARLSVFRGGCTLEAIEEVTGGFLDTVQSLVDKSLLRHTGERFWMLETILEYATERLADSSYRNDLRRRHALHFLARAEEAEPHLLAATDLGEWLDRLQSEHDNFRAALDWLAESGETQLALRLAGALIDFWDLRGHFVEGIGRLEAVVAADEEATGARAKALYGIAELSGGLGDIARAKTSADESASLYLSLGDTLGAANAQHLIAYVAAEQGDWPTAQRLAEEVVRTLEDAGAETLALRAMRLLAWTTSELGEQDRTRELHEQILRRARQVGDVWMLATQLGVMATTWAVPEGDVARASSLLRESLPLWRDIGDRAGITLELSRCAETLLAAGQPATAAALVTCAEHVRSQHGFNELWITRMIEGNLAKVREQLGDEAFTEAAVRGRAMSLDDALDMALDALSDLT